MLNWLKKISGHPVNLENRSGIDSRALSFLKSDLNALNQCYKGLGAVLLKYVVDGEGEEVLLQLGGNANLGKVMKLNSVTNYYDDRDASKEREAFFSKKVCRDGHVLHRLANVYAAVHRTQAQAFRMWNHIPDEHLWFEVLLLESIRYHYAGEEPDSVWQASELEQVLAAADADTGLLVLTILGRDPNSPYSYYNQHIFEKISGLGDYYARHPKSVIEALSDSLASHRVLVLESLSKEPAAYPYEVIEKICSLAVANAKTVREAAMSCIMELKEHSGDAIKVLQTLLREGTNTERLHAVGQLIRLQGQACHVLLREQLEVEKGKKIIAEIEKYLQIRTEPTAEDVADQIVYDDELTPPPVKDFEAQYEFSPELEAAFMDVVARYNAEAKKRHTENWDRMDKKWRRGPREISDPLSAKQAKAMWLGIQNPKACESRKGQVSFNHYEWPHLLHKEMGDFVKSKGMELVPVIRLGWALGLIGPDKDSHYRTYYINEELKEWMAACIAASGAEGFGLADVGRAFAVAGLTETWVERMYVDWGWNSRWNPLGLSDDHIWPFFHSHTDLLEQAFGLKTRPGYVPDYCSNDFRTRAYQVLATFPKPPKQFVNMLWDDALGTAKRFRPLAQACLVNYPGKEDIIIRSLSDSKKDVRFSAAKWLGELNAVEAIKPLKKALDKEKYDEPKAAMMEALEAMGEDIDQFLNRKKLQEEAEKELKKAIHKDLKWFPFDGLPEVHWEKNRQKVSPEILQWFVVQGFRLKQAEPSPLLRRYTALMRPDERKALGLYVLEAWLRQDTLPMYNHEQAAELAEQDLANTKQWVSKHPEYYPDFNEDTHRKNALNRYLNECLGSASSSKGILSIAGACCGPEIVPTVQRYLKQWYGRRMAQCNALLQMLSWVDHPLAIQLILSVATRFRTKGIQKQAAACADEIAERKGWTRDEMADRTVPSAGFERDGTQIIDYGSRQFTATLLDDFSIELRNPDGKVIKSLPNATKADDEDEVKVMKKEFTASKRELKQVLKLQQERLYEAMCSERQWRYEDWQMFLNGHPIVGRFCQRLVWMAKRGDETVGVFRPLADRTLTDVDDNEISLQGDDLIQVAHASYMDGEQAKAWSQHLLDYEVEPLFAQFGGDSFRVTPENEDLTEIKEFEGHLVNSFKLRSRTGKLGYTRGAAEDGGWFHTYLKNFPGLGVQAVIEFTGNILPEENRTVALLQMYFIRFNQNESEQWSHAHRPMKLKELPEVLVMECRNDMKVMAADGSGFDPEWEKKSEW